MNPYHEKVAEIIKKHKRHLCSGVIDEDFIDIDFIKELADLYEKEDKRARRNSYTLRTQEKPFNPKQFLKRCGGDLW